MNGPKGNWFRRWLAGAPVVGDFLVVQVPHAGDERGMVVLSRPIDRLLLCLESREHMVGVILEHEVLDRASFRPPFGTRLTYTLGTFVLPRFVKSSY